MSVTVNIQAAGGYSHYWNNFYTQLANSPIADGSDTAFLAIDNGDFNGEAFGTRFIFSGTGFTYSGSFPDIHLTSGTITGIEIRDAADNVLATFTGFDISASAFNSALATFVTGHGPNPGEDGTPDPSGFDAIFRALGYTVTGNSGADTFEGGNLADTINGSGGADFLIGAGGADTMAGGLGNDVYVVDDIGDDVNEADGEGSDSVHAYISPTLAENVENLSLLGTALVGTGNELNNRIFGNFAANTLYGMDGNDYLDGGLGADILVGGKGNDNYIVDDINDVIGEGADEGYDVVLSNVTYTLSDNVENLNLQGNAAINGTGNDGANELYGNSAVNFLSGRGGNDYLSGGEGADSMDGGAGDDTFLVENAGDIVIESAGEGTDLVYSSVSYTLSANVENLTLTKGNLTGTGNDLNNEIIGYNGGGFTLMGLGGNDTLWGQSGADTMYGGTGDDLYYVDVAGDAVIENAGEGTDTVYTYINHTLGDNVENLEMHYAGNLAGYGNALSNRITGNGNNNVIDGGAGADVMSGGAGNDAYFVDDAGDQVIENANEGSDTVYSTAHFALGANIEHLVLQGNTDLQGYGNALSNAIYGNSGDNLLDGRGGSDMMVGGDGNDAYFVDHGGDGVYENANEGFDTVYSTAHLALGDNVENLVLQGTADLQGYGNAMSNAIYGNSGSNLLDGRGGADMMVGGEGNDAYFVDDAGDGVHENANEGFDTVYSTAHLVLGANVENLVLQGNADLQGYGNGLSNAIYGNAGSNLLDGRGGADLMAGGDGNDVYFVDDAGDGVHENANEGIDTVFSTAHFRLSADVENLVLQGSADLQGYGNEQANAVYGNSGRNLIDGGGGQDYLTGDAGNDVFLFRSGEANGDAIADFNGNGAGSGDAFYFLGFGTAAQGATFAQIGNTNQWQIHSGLDGHDETITLANSATVHASDFIFM